MSPPRTDTPEDLAAARAELVAAEEARERVQAILRSPSTRIAYLLHEIGSPVDEHSTIVGCFPTRDDAIAVAMDEMRGTIDDPKAWENRFAITAIRAVPLTGPWPETREAIATRLRSALPDLTEDDALAAAENMYPDCLRQSPEQHPR